MATATPASPTSSDSSAAPSAAPDSAPAPESGAESYSRPAYQSEDEFFGGGGDEGTPEGEPESDPDAPVDPTKALESALASISDPVAKAAVEKQLKDLRAQAGRAPSAQRESSANYKAAEAWKQIADAALERARGVGADVSDLAAGELPDEQPAYDEGDAGLNFEALTEQSLQTLSGDWTEKILAGYDEAESLMDAARDFEATGDEAGKQRGAQLRKQARAIRGRLIQAQAHSAVWAASGLLDKSHQHLSSSYGQLRGMLSTGQSEATNNAMVGEALSVMADIVDEAGAFPWFENGFFERRGDKRGFGPLGRDLISPMLEWIAERELDPRDPNVFSDAFAVALQRSGRLRRAAKSPTASAPAARGDATSGLAGAGAPSVATPPTTSSSAQFRESPEALAARKNRSAFASR